MTEPYNVLMIVLDDLRPNLGCYGDRLAISPHIDAIAARGTVFERAYCQQAVCNPSRSSLLTGCRPDTIRVCDLETHFRSHAPDVVTLPQHFKAHGYRTRGVGKVYHGTESLQDPESWSREAELSYTREYRYALRDNLAAKANGWKKAAATECADVDDNAYIDGMVAERAIAVLRELNARPEPFFLAVGIRKPHLPFCAPRQYWDMQDEDGIGVISNPLPPEDVPAMALHDWRELRGYRDIPDQGPLTAAQEAHLRHGYYAATTYADAQIGKVIAELDRLELGSSTVICLWGDHGWHLGEHGLWGKTTNFELDTRSPLIISVPHQARVGTSSRSLVEFVDVYPTLADVCGLNQPAHVEGVSLAPLLDDPTTRVKEYALSQFPRPWPVGERPEYMGYSLRSERYRYTEWRELESGAVGARELYDHDNDPLESVNLAGRREHEGAAEHLRSALRTSPATMRCRKNGRAPG